MKQFFKESFGRQITKEMSKDTGMAMVLLLLIVALVTKKNGYVVAALVALVVDMAVPLAYKHVAVVWFGLSHVLGTVVSKILLTLVFFLVVTPMGVLRQWMGKDSMMLKAFKASRESVMKERNHTYTPADIEKPY